MREKNPSQLCFRVCFCFFLTKSRVKTWFTGQDITHSQANATDQIKRISNKQRWISSFDLFTNHQDHFKESRSGRIQESLYLKMYKLQFIQSQAKLVFTVMIHKRTHVLEPVDITSAHQHGNLFYPHLTQVKTKRGFRKMKMNELGR